MPSIKKRIGYLPSPDLQKLISEIANKENLSKSKVVDILVGEALLARGLLNLRNTNNLRRNNLYQIEKTIDPSSSSFRHNDLDELISDKGITYSSKKNKLMINNILSQSREDYNEELFDQFKQFLLFKKKNKKTK